MHGAKYHSIRDEVRDLIDGLAIGDALPPERALAAEFGVSRMTLRRAIDDLVREGYVVRRQGAGTFVAEPKITQSLAVTSFTEDMRRRGHVPSSRTVSLEQIDAGPRLARRLDLSPESQILRVVRLRLADAAPMAIETLHVPLDVTPGLTADDLTDGSFYDLLRERYAVRIAGGVQAIEPTVTNADESDLLGVPLHSPAFLFERTTRAHDGRTIEFVRSVYRGDRYQLTVEIEPPAPAARPVRSRSAAGS